MSEVPNTTEIPYGIVSAGKSKVNYLTYRPTSVTKKNVKGIPGMDLLLKATVDSPRTSREIRRALGGSFGREKLLSHEFNL